MPKIRWNHVMFILLGFPIVLNGQIISNNYPVSFSQYFNCFSLVNPAASCSLNKYEITVGDKKFLGSFNKISTYYLNAAMRFGNNGYRYNSSFSSAGVFVSNEQEGKYLNRCRFYAIYTWHGSLSENIKISGGFHLGAMSYLVKGTPLSGNGSDIAPDGSVGIWIYNTSFHIGASYNQIFNSKIQPLDEVAILSPYLNFDGNYEFSLSENFRLSPSFSVRKPLKDSFYLFDYTLSAGFKNVFEVATGIHDSNKLINTVEIKHLLNEKSPVVFCLTYGFPLKRQDISTNFIEFGIKYCQ
jgi:hypothetical protein